MSLSRIKIRSIFLLAIAFSCWLPTASVQAQRRTLDNVPEGPVDFSVHSVPFYDPVVGRSDVIVQYRVVNDHLLFIKSDGRYRADFQVICVVYDQDGRQITGEEVSGTQWAGTYDQTNSRDLFVEGHFQFSLDPGEYQLKIWIEGQHTGEMVRTEIRTTVPNFQRSDLSISGLLLAYQIIPGGQEQIPEGGWYERRGLFISPSINHIFSDLQPHLFCYFEVYDESSGGVPADEYESIVEMIDPSDQVVLSDTGAVRRRDPVSYAFRDFRVDSLQEDRYLLRLTIEDQVNDRTARVETSLYIRWSALGHVAKDYEEAVEQLRYIATDEEYKQLKEAKGEDRRDAWLEFWKERDPTPGTPANEMRTEYYLRIEYANTHFSVVSAGWKTDRGRIYIIYGAPDDIERHPMEIGVKPYQIWHYYSSNRRFYFVDEDGYGDYKLVAWR
jgi:GWxTD domain-containing protein